MRLLILGATGGTGRQLTSQAVKHGHRVTAFVRSPQKLGSLRDRVAVREGDPRSVAELETILPGHDAVISALGPPGCWTDNDPPRCRWKHRDGDAGSGRASAGRRLCRGAVRRSRHRR